MRIVLDSNILLVAIGRKSRFNPIWQSFLNAYYELIITEEIVHEYEEVLQEHAVDGAAKLVLQILNKSSNIIFKSVSYKWHAITNDPDDNKFFDAAVAANVDYLVTNDGHFNEAKRLAFPKVNIVSADDFLQIIEEWQYNQK